MLAIAMLLVGQSGNRSDQPIHALVSVVVQPECGRLQFSHAAEPIAAVTPLPDPVPPSPNAQMLQPDIVVTGHARTPGDPLQEANAKSFAATQAVDKALVGPVALAYAHHVPAPVRSGLRNLFSNLHEPVVFLNYLLQLKPGKAAETAGRFAINSTVGAAGLFDIAKRRPFHLPRRPNGLADTLGYYGVKPGPFLYLPLIGPTTVRDLVGGVLDRFVLPLSVGKPFNQLIYTVPIGVISELDHRAEFDEQLHELHDNTADPYAASREYYLRRREAEIDQLHARRRRAVHDASDPPHHSTISTASSGK